MVHAEIVDAQKPVSEAVQATVSNPVQDAAHERGKATFNVQRLAEYINDGNENIMKRYTSGTEVDLNL